MAAPSVLIIGGGALGMSGAYHLLQQGVEDVTVVERQFPGAGATGWSAGLISVQLWDPHDVRLVLRSMELFELARERAHLTLRKEGMFTLAGEGDATVWERQVAMQQDAGANVELLPQERWKERLPTIRTDDVAVISHAPDDGMATPGDFALALSKVCRVKGATIHQNQQVRALLAEGHRIAGAVLEDGTELHADATVLAAGVWSAPLCATAGLTLPVSPYRTQLATMKLADARQHPIVHDAAADCYFRPEADNELLIGNGTTHDREDPEQYDANASPSFVESIAAKLLHRIPSAATAQYAAGWAGLILATPDRHPLIGPHPQASDLWCCLGGNGFGFMRSAALGELLAHRLLERALPDALSGMEDYGLPQRLRSRWDEPFQARSGFTLA